MVAETIYTDPFGVTGTIAKAGQFRNFGEAASAIAVCAAAPSVAGTAIADSAEVAMHTAGSMIIVALRHPSGRTSWLARIPVGFPLP